MAYENEEILGLKHLIIHIILKLLCLVCHDNIISMRSTFDTFHGAGGRYLRAGVIKRDIEIYACGDDASGGQLIVKQIADNREATAAISNITPHSYRPRPAVIYVPLLATRGCAYHYLRAANIDDIRRYSCRDAMLYQSAWKSWYVGDAAPILCYRPRDADFCSPSHGDAIISRRGFRRDDGAAASCSASPVKWLH